MDRAYMSLHGHVLTYVQQGHLVLVKDIALGGLALGFFRPVMFVKVCLGGQGPRAIVALKVMDLTAPPPLRSYFKPRGFYPHLQVVLDFYIIFLHLQVVADILLVLNLLLNLDYCLEND